MIFFFASVISGPRGGGGTPLFGLYGDVPLDRVWVLGLAVLNRVYNWTCLCPKQGQNLSYTGYGITSRETNSESENKLNLEKLIVRLGLTIIISNISSGTA